MSVQYVPTGPTRGEAYADVLHNLFVEQPQARAAQQQQDAVAAQKRREDFLKNLSTITDPQLRQAGILMAKQMGIAIPDMPTPEPTAEQQMQVAAQRSMLNTMKRGEEPQMTMGGTAADTAGAVPTGAPMPMLNVPAGHVPSPYDKIAAYATARALNKAPLSAEELKYTGAQDTGGDAALSQTNAIDTGRALNAEKSQIELPQVQPKIANEKAQATKNQADAIKAIADARKAGLEADALKQQATESTSMGNLTGQDYLNALPEARKRIVQAALDYKLDPEKIAAIRARSGQTSERMTLVKDLEMVDPSFDMSQYPQRYAARKAFAPGGTSAVAEASLNTAIRHLETVDNLGGNLDNVGGVPLINNMLNAAKNEVFETSGGSSVPAFNQARDIVANEVQKAVRGSGVLNETEVNRAISNLDTNQSPSARKAVIKTIVTMLAPRMEELRRQKEYALGKPADMRILSPEARVSLRNLGVDPEQIEPSAKAAPSQGGNAQSSPAQYKQVGTVTLHDGSQRRAGTNDGKTFFDLTTGAPIQ